MIRVIPFSAPYGDKVRRLCLENAGCRNAAPDAQQYLLLQNCDYYLEHEPENCFIAVEEDDSLVGCILASDSYEKYAAGFERDVLPKAAALSSRRYVSARFSMLRFGMFRSLCPAHFFINVREGSRSIGAGDLLLSTLVAHLRQRYVPALMLVCDPENDRAIAFFKKHGFETEMTTRFGAAMLLKIAPPGEEREFETILP